MANEHSRKRDINRSDAPIGIIFRNFYAIRTRYFGKFSGFSLGSIFKTPRKVEFDLEVRIYNVELWPAIAVAVVETHCFTLRFVIISRALGSCSYRLGIVCRWLGQAWLAYWGAESGEDHR